MGGQMLGGGVIVAVAALLWIVYLLPSWQSRMRDNAAERNAVRLNQALRVLAQTSETPDEIRVELSAREARAQQKLVKRLRAEDERLRSEQSRLEVERKRLEVQAEVERTRDEAELEKERRRQELVREAEQRRREILAARLAPDVVRARQARARRIVRLISTFAVIAGIGLTAAGSVLLAQGGTGWVLAGGIAAVLAGAQALRRMAEVARRARRRSVPALAEVEEAQPSVVAVRRQAPQLMNPEDRGWKPRTLPAPLTAVSGSRASLALDGARAQEALRAAAREEALRAQIETAAPVPAPVPITSAQRPAAESTFARMGYVDDAEIEAHVRDLLARRAAV